MAVQHTSAPAHSVAQAPIAQPLWWLQPLTVVAVLGGFSGYAFWSVVVAFLWVDAARGFIFDGRLGLGLGSIVLLVNVVLLTAYTFSCHSLRHLVGGGLDCFSCSRARYSFWQMLSRINPNHGMFAWFSLFSVVAADLYVRLLSAGILTDLRFF